jgi:uncharacterized membrane protein YhaH (DUF805 family)
MNHAAQAAVETAAGAGTSKLAFTRHFVEMVLVMFIGMGVFEGLAALGFAAADSSLSAQSGELRVMLMGVSMTVPMIAWMAHRGHSASRNAEMAISMIAPTLLAGALAWTGAIGTATAFGIQHVVMMPAMLAVMLWRYDEYAHKHGSHT